MVQKDLSAAGIPYETADGIADFHAAGRHSYITQVIRSGVSLPTAMGLARHSDVKMTMRYTHIGIDDQATALAHLPLPTAGEPADALQMRCISGVSGGAFGVTGWQRARGQETSKPLQLQGFRH